MKIQILTNIIKPSALDTSCRFMDSAFNKLEKELVASNIVKLSVRHGNEWLRFTFERYVALCDHKPGWQEKGVLESFVEDGLLSKDESGAYEITDLFIATLWKFVKPDAVSTEAKV